MARHGEQSRQRTPGHVQNQKQQGQQQQHQVEGQIHPVRRPEYRDAALVIADKKRDRHRHAKQCQKPQGGPHVYLPAAAVARAASVSSTRGNCSVFI